MVIMITDFLTDCMHDAKSSDVYYVCGKGWYLGNHNVKSTDGCGKWCCHGIHK